MLKNRGLWKKKTRENGWSISNNSKTKYWQRMLLFWEALKNLRSWNLNTRRSPQKIRRGNGSLRKESN